MAEAGRPFFSFLSSKAGKLTILLLALIVATFFVVDIRSRDQERREARGFATPTPLAERPVETVTRRSAPPLPTPTPRPVAKETPIPQKVAQATPTPVPTPPERIRVLTSPVALPAIPVSPPKEVIPPGNPATRGSRRISDRFAPYGRLISCSLVNTVDSSRVETPVIGLTVEDVWHNGNLIIPAGSEVHGTAQTDRERGRIRAEGKWVIVLNGFDKVVNGEEMTVDGVALARQDESAKYGGAPAWGELDGSFGLIGKTIRSDNWSDVKLFLATFLGAASSSLQSRDNPIISPFGGASTQGPVQATPQNAGLSGASAVVDAYAKQLQDEIKENGFYTRVSAGSQFYLYVRQTLDVGDARIGDSEAEREAMAKSRLAAERRNKPSSPSDAPLISDDQVRLFQQMAAPSRVQPATTPDPRFEELRQSQAENYAPSTIRPLATPTATATP